MRVGGLSNTEVDVSIVPVSFLVMASVSVHVDGAQPLCPCEGCVAFLSSSFSKGGVASASVCCKKGVASVFISPSKRGMASVSVSMKV